MKRAGGELVSLEVRRATQEDPHVRVVIEAWHLGAGRWYAEPATHSRMGDLRRGAWLLLADACIDYGASLCEYAGGLPPRKRGRRHRVGRRRG